MSKWHICSFSVTDGLPKNASYEAVKSAVLVAGRFSCFEASERPKLFDRLEHDDELKITRMAFPWIKVELKKDVQR